MIECECIECTNTDPLLLVTSRNCKNRSKVKRLFEIDVSEMSTKDAVRHIRNMIEKYRTKSLLVE